MLKVKIDGIEEIRKALGGDFAQVMKGATLEIARNIHQEVSTYPAKTDANTEGRPQGWYQRGWGPKWPSNPARRPKQRRGTKPIIYGPDWAGYPTSEDLIHTWAVKQKGIGAIVGSRATDAPVVHHWKEQMKKHGQRGWKTDKQAVANVKGLIDGIVKRAVARKLGGK